MSGMDMYVTRTAELAWATGLTVVCPHSKRRIRRNIDSSS
jgi:hypothetical protein